MEFDTQWGYWRVNIKRFGYGFWIWYWCIVNTIIICLIPAGFVVLWVLALGPDGPLLLLGPSLGTIMSLVSVISGIRQKDQDRLFGGILGSIPSVVFLVAVVFVIIPYLQTRYSSGR